MSAKDEHRTDGYDSEILETYVIEATTDANNTNNRKEIHHIIKADMDYEITFADVPKE